MAYCQQLQVLRNNTAFLQEMNERRAMLMLSAVQLDVSKPQLRGELGKIEGQIICLDWILLELVNMQPTEAPNIGHLDDY